MHEMMYEFDRAGVFEVGSDPAEAIELVTRLPIRVIEKGLALLLKTETWFIRGGSLVWPKWLEGQTAKRSDAVRAAEYRARRRDGVTLRDEAVTPGDDDERTVTNRHEESRPSRNVTLSSALPGSALPSSQPPPPPARGLRGALGDRLVPRAPVTGEPPAPRHDPAFERIPFSRWFPSGEMMAWCREKGLSDAQFDAALVEARDQLTGRHDFEWFDTRVWRFLDVAIDRANQGSKPRASRQPRPRDHGVDLRALIERPQKPTGTEKP